MQNENTSISDCVDKLPYEGQSPSNECVFVTHAEISVESIKHGQTAEKENASAPSGNADEGRENTNVVEITNSASNPTTPERKAKPVKYMDILNKMPFKKLKAKPQLNRVNGFASSEKKCDRPKCNGKIASSSSDNISSPSKAVVATPLLSSIVLANDPFTFVPGQLCTPQVAFAASTELPSEKTQPPVQESDGFESSENLAVDSDSETSVTEEVLEEVDNPVIHENDQEGKPSAPGGNDAENLTHSRTEDMTNRISDDTFMDADITSSPDNTGRKRQRNGSKWTQPKRMCLPGNNTNSSMDSLSTSSGEILSSESVSTISESKSVVIVLKPSQVKSRKKQAVESHESSVKSSRKSLTSMSESLNKPDQTSQVENLVSGVSFEATETSAPHKLLCQEGEDLTCSTSLMNSPASTKSTKPSVEISVVNGIPNVSGDTSDVKVDDTKSLDQLSVENQAPKSPIEAKSNAYQKRIIALQKARAARWQKFHQKIKEREDARKNNHRNEAGISSSVVNPEKSITRSAKSSFINMTEEPTESYQSNETTQAEDCKASRLKKTTTLRRKRKVHRFSTQRKKKKKTLIDKALNESLEKPKLIKKDRKSKKLSTRLLDYNMYLAENLPAKMLPSRSCRKLSNSVLSESISEDNNEGVDFEDEWVPLREQMEIPTKSKRAKRAHKRLKKNTVPAEPDIEDNFFRAVYDEATRATENKRDYTASCNSSDSIVQNESDTVVHQNPRRWSRKKGITSKRIGVKPRKNKLCKLSRRKSFSLEVMDQVLQPENINVLSDQSYSFTSVKSKHSTESAVQQPISSTSLSPDNSGLKGVSPVNSANTEWSNATEDIGQADISTGSSPRKGGIGSSIGGVISQLFDDITTKPGNGFVVNIRLDVERKQCLGQCEANVSTSDPVSNASCGTFSNSNLTTSKSDSISTSTSSVTSLSNLDLCILLEERLVALTDLRPEVRGNLLDNIRHVKRVLHTACFN